MPCWTLATFSIYQKDKYNNDMNLNELFRKIGGG